jgi:hypothetical protein
MGDIVPALIDCSYDDSPIVFVPTNLDRETLCIFTHASHHAEKGVLIAYLRRAPTGGGGLSLFLR